MAPTDVAERPAAATEDEHPAAGDRHGAGGSRSAGTRRPAPSLAAVVGLAFGIFGLAIGTGSLHDNSFLTHLATGRIILDRHAVPTVDPYSFTAHGRPWVVQSWLASVLYAGTERIGGLGLLRTVLGVGTGVLALLVWRLTRPARTLVPRVLVAGAVVAGGVAFWVERPLTIGLIGLAVVLLAADGELDPRWLVPVMWVWVNSHGSFPLGIGVLVLLVAGRAADRRLGLADPTGERRPPEQRALGWSVVGTALGAVNPLGPTLLAFPLRLLAHSENFRAVVEWQPPRFDQPGQQLFLLELVVAVAVVALRRRRVSSLLLVAAFAALALTSARNIAPAAIVLTPIVAGGLAGLGSVSGDRRSPATRGGAIALGALALVVGVGTLRTQPDTRLTAYPTEAVAWMHAHDLVAVPGARVVAPDYVGNFLEARYGSSARAYIDDRVDMYPTSVVRSMVVLKHLEPGWQQVLDRARPSAVVWKSADPLGRALARSPRWRVAHRDRQWAVYVPVTPPA